MGIPTAVSSPRINQPPVCSNLAVSTPEDKSVSFTLPATDADGDPLHFTILTQPTHGMVLQNNEICTYVPGRDFNGTDTLTFRTFDLADTSAPATVTITVNPANDAPVAHFDRVWIPVGGTFAALDVLANDSDPDGGAVSVVGFTQPQHGAVTQTSPGFFNYIPAGGWSGRDQFTYTLRDPQGLEATGTVIVFTGNPEVARYALNEASGTVAADSSGNGRNATLVTSTSPDNRSPNPKSGTPVFSPTGGHDGAGAVDFNGVGGVMQLPVDTTLNGVVSQRTVSMWVKPRDIPNAGFYAHNILYEEGENSRGLILGMDSDGKLCASVWDLGKGLEIEYFEEEKMIVTYLTRDRWQHVVLVLDAGPDATAEGLKLYIDGRLVGSTYGVEMSARTDAIGIGGKSGTYRSGTLDSSDGYEQTYGGLIDDVRIYNWMLEPDEILALKEDGEVTNSSPSASPISTATLAGTPAALTLQATDPDPEDTLYFEIVTQPSHGSLSGTNASRTYTPAGGFTGTDTFTYRASDGKAWSATVSATIRVVASNQPPVANAGNDMLAGFGSVPLNGSASSDPDGHALA